MDVEKPGCKDSSIETIDGKHDGDLKLLSLWIELQLYYHSNFFFFFWEMKWLTSQLYMNSLFEIWISSNWLCNKIQSRNILILHVIWWNNLTCLSQTKKIPWKTIHHSNQSGAGNVLTHYVVDVHTVNSKIFFWWVVSYQSDRISTFLWMHPFSLMVSMIWSWQEDENHIHSLEFC